MSDFKSTKFTLIVATLAVVGAVVIEPVIVNSLLNNVAILGIDLISGCRYYQFAMVTRFWLFSVVAAMLVSMGNIRPIFSGLGISAFHLSKSYIFLTLSSFGGLAIPYFASANPNFQQVYPYCREAIENKLVLLTWWPCWALGLLAIEILFRGALIHGVRFKTSAMNILLSTTLYVALHYDKPLEELISSAFGGAFLSMLSLRYKSILPGWILHCCLAFAMDCFSIARQST